MNNMKKGIIDKRTERMRSYRQEVFTIQKMLKEFVDSGRIEPGKLDVMDDIIEWSEEDQIKILNNSYIPLYAQRPFFGAIRNVNISLKGMKERLGCASSQHENPTTAEQALELIPSFLNLTRHIDSILNENIFPTKLGYISKFSRILHKKAVTLGFSQDVASQLKEAGVSDAQIESFIDGFSKNVSLELNIEEEVSSTRENSD